MIRIENKEKKIISIDHYKILEVLQTDENKDIFHVSDIKNTGEEYTLKILKLNQNPKQIDTEIEILNILNSYENTINFRKMELYRDKIVLVFDYTKGDDLQSLYNLNPFFFDEEKLKLLVYEMSKILEIYNLNNILHRNIKAENIIFDGEKYCLIGLSKATISDDANQTTDIFSFFKVLYYLLTGDNYEEKVTICKNTDSELLKIVKNGLENKNLNKNEMLKLLKYINKI